jgi:hypothetical protein
LEDLTRERKIAAEKEAELLMEREQRALRDKQLAEKERHANYLAQALENARSENVELSQALDEVFIHAALAHGNHDSGLHNICLLRTQKVAVPT